MGDSSRQELQDTDQLIMLTGLMHIQRLVTGGTERDYFAPVTGRYVRMYGTERTTIWGYSLWEFEVYGAIEGDPPKFLREILR